MNDFYADIHLHSTIKPLLTKYTDNVWTTYDYQEDDSERGGGISRSDFGRLIRNNIRLVGLSLHTPERYVLNNLTTRPFILSKLLDVSLENLRKVWFEKPFSMLKAELNLLKNQLKSPDGKYYAVIAKNYKHLVEILKDPNALAIMLTIEGAHNIGLEYRNEDFPVHEKKANGVIEPAEPLSEELIDARIEFMKRENVFFITLTHFVYNHLATMARAVEVTGWKKLAKNPFRSLDLVGKFRGITYLGKYFIEKLFENNILVDIKHCDAVTRRQVYKIAEKHGKPVIGSHVAVSGKITNVGKDYTLIKPNDTVRDRQRSKQFNPWDINLHNDDILAIHRSDGLMGLILDKRVLASVKEEKLMEEHPSGAHLFFNQIVHIYQTLVEEGVSPKNALKNICLGSDYDGFIEPIKGYATIDDIRYNPDEHDPNAPKLDKDLTSLIKENYHIFKKTKLDAEEIVAMIFRENVTNFLKKYWK